MTKWVKKLKKLGDPKMRPMSTSLFELRPKSPSEDGSGRPARGGSLSLRRDAVHLWFASLEQSAATVSELERLLSRDETERADRFKFPGDRRRFVVRRGLLRRLLGGYLGCEPSAIGFDYGPFGKPSMVQQSSLAPLCFNLSHSGSLAVLAFARNRQLGVDVEKLDVTIDVEQMATQFFAPRETADIMMRPLDQRHSRFLEFWTRKEALIKAQGRGLSAALHDLDTLMFDDGPTDSGKAVAGHPIECLSVMQFSPASGYVAALAVSGAAYRVSYREVRWTQLRACFTSESRNHV